MKRFTPVFRGSAWSDGLKVLHVYLLPDPTEDRELARLAAL